MNTKINSLFLVGTITASILSTQFAFAGGEEKAAIEKNRLANTKEYKDMKRSLNNIQKDKERIVYYKSEWKESRKADKAIQTQSNKKELRKAKADLRRDKKYLRIDKRDLAADQWTAIKTQQHEKKAVKKELRHAKCAVRKDLRKEDAAAFRKDSARVDTLYAQLQTEKNQSVALKEDTYEFFALLDEEIDDVV